MRSSPKESEGVRSHDFSHSANSGRLAELALRRIRCNHCRVLAISACEAKHSQRHEMHASALSVIFRADHCRACNMPSHRSSSRSHEFFLRHPNCNCFDRRNFASRMARCSMCTLSDRHGCPVHGKSSRDTATSTAVKAEQCESELRECNEWRRGKNGMAFRHTVENALVCRTFLP